MKILISSHNTNGVGLQRDFCMLKRELETLGHQVSGVQWNQPSIPRADLIIFQELFTEKFLTAAPRAWVIPNPDWWQGSWTAHLHRVEHVFAKTHDCERIFTQFVGGKCSYLGWQSLDFYKPEIPRQRTFCHLAGKSQMKNTQAVLQCWRQYTPDAELTVVSQHYPQLLRGDQEYPRTTFYKWLPEANLIHLMNSHQFHLCPSAYEGYGYALHEALGVKAFLITTDRPPMNECFPPVVIPAHIKKRWNTCNWYEVTPEDVRDAVEQALAFPEDEIQEIGEAARDGFLEDNREFRMRLAEWLT